jgi:hypothetical protein
MKRPSGKLRERSNIYPKSPPLSKHCNKGYAKAFPTYQRKRSYQLYLSQNNSFPHRVYPGVKPIQNFTWILQKWMRARGLASSSSKCGPVVTSCEHGNKYLGFKKRGKSLDSDLLAFQERRCFMQWLYIWASKIISATSYILCKNGVLKIKKPVWKMCHHFLVLHSHI